MTKLCKTLILLVALLGCLAAAEAQQITGRVTSERDGTPLVGVTVNVKERTTGALTGADGTFQIVASPGNTLIFRYLGFKTLEMTLGTEAKLDVQLEEGTQDLNEVVVTASRGKEKLLKSPVSIEKLDIRALKETPAASFYDALGNVKGVQLTTSSITFKVPNTRVFNIPNNFRFMQLVDGVDMQAATLGVPLGNAIGPTELDVQSIEITPGAASALYGMNAINGMANLITKDPFTNQGLSFFQRVGTNHVDGIDHEPALMTETAIRYAKAFKNKLAFKINASYLQGTDWISNTRTDQNPNNKKTANPDYIALDGVNNAAFDGWNKYGDDALAGSNTVSITGLNINGISNRTLTVARTG